MPGTDTKGLGPDKPDGGLVHPGWYDGFLFSQALTIGGGTGDVQRNIVAERVLGLPHDVDVAGRAQLGRGPRGREGIVKVAATDRWRRRSVCIARA